MTIFPWFTVICPVSVNETSSLFSPFYCIDFWHSVRWLLVPIPSYLPSLLLNISPGALGCTKTIDKYTNNGTVFCLFRWFIIFGWGYHVHFYRVVLSYTSVFSKVFTNIQNVLSSVHCTLYRWLMSSFITLYIPGLRCCSVICLDSSV